jgi:rubrerythrin
MELGAILLILALTVLVAFFVAQPFLEQKRSVKLVSAEEHLLSSLLADRDRLITALQELDFDHTLGKIPAEDYPVMRAELLQNAADVLRRLDEIAPAAAKGARKAPSAEDRVEAAVAARRADAAPQARPQPAAPDEEDDIEALLAARRAARKEKTAGFCSRCGKALLKSDKFCPACGNPIH